MTNKLNFIKTAFNMIKVMFLAAGVLLLISCSNKKEAKKKEIVIAVRGGNEHFVQQKRIIELFERDNPDIKVTIAQFPAWNNYLGPLITKLIGNMQIDIFILSGENEVLTLSRKGLLLDLSDENIEFKTEIYPQLLDQATVDKRLYALPAWVNPMLLFYNKKIFSETGINFPDENMVFEQLYLLMKKLNNKQLGRYGAILHPGFFWIDYLLQQHGLFSVDYRLQHGLLNNNEHVQTIRKYIEMFSVHQASPRTDELQQNGKNELFFLDKTAMLFSGPFLFTLLKEQKDLEWDIAFYPRAQKRLVWLSTVFWAINAKTGYKEEAIRYVKFLETKKIQSFMYKLSSDMSPFNERNIERNKIFAIPRSRNILIDYFNFERYCPVRIGDFESYKQKIDDIFSLMSLNNKNIAEGCQEINAILTEALKKDNEQQ